MKIIALIIDENEDFSYPAGNHEYFPMSFFDPKEKPEALALYSQIMDPLLETEEEKASFRAGGMFTRVVREGLRWRGCCVAVWY